MRCVAPLLLWSGVSPGALLPAQLQETQGRPGLGCWLLKLEA